VRNALSTTENAKMTLSRSRDGQNSKSFEPGFTMYKALSTVENARMTLSKISTLRFLCRAVKSEKQGKKGKKQPELT
jgi:hypothetical protein